MITNTGERRFIVDTTVGAAAQVNKNEKILLHNNKHEQAVRHCPLTGELWFVNAKIVQIELSDVTIIASPTLSIKNIEHKSGRMSESQK